MKKHFKPIFLSCTLILATSAWGQFNFSSIANEGNIRMSQVISSTAPLVVTAYKLVGDYYNQMSVCPAAGQFAMNTTQVPEVLSISNSNNCIVVLTFQQATASSTTPIPLSGTTIAVAPQLITATNGSNILNFNTPLVYANFFDSSLLQTPPSCGTSISTLTNSSYGVPGRYAADPVAAATKEVMGGNGCN